MIPLAACAAALAACALLARVATADDLFAFMPKGGQTLLLEVIAGAPAPDAVTALVTGKRTAEEWLAYLAANPGRLPAVSTFTDQQRKTLAGYLAIAMPLPNGNQPGAAGAAAWRAVLPPDGRELALKSCQGCHSLYSGYLTQSRDAQGWRGTFDVSYHQGLLPAASEREAFISYSAINMPVPDASIPVALRY